jgi:tetrahydromethanopterin S-methyltransferase subunit G
MSEELTKHHPGDDLKLILSRLDSIDSRLDTVEAQLKIVDHRLVTLEDKVDRRLQETRPIWEQVLARLDGLENGVHNLETETRNGFRKLERQVGLLAQDVLEVRADQRDLERRVDKVESEPAQ